MKINSIRPAAAVKHYERAISRSGVSYGAAARSDKVEFSDTAQSFVAAIKAVKASMAASSPEELKRVQELSAMVHGESYSVASDQIAGKMLLGTKFDGEA